MKKFKLVAGVFLFFIQSLICNASETIFVLDFNSLPSNQGFVYDHLNNSLSESDVFSVDGTTLFQNSLAAGFQGQGDNAYLMSNAIDPAAIGFTLELRAKIIQENNNPASGGGHNHFGLFAGGGFGRFAIGGHAVTLRSNPAITEGAHPNDAVLLDTSVFHDYLYDGDLISGTYQFFVDGIQRGEGVLPTGDNLLGIGDGSGGSNAQAEVTRFVFTQQFPTPPAVLLMTDEDFMSNGTNCSDVEFATGPACVSIEECAFGACPGVEDPSIDNDPSVLVSDDIASIPGVSGGCQAITEINTIAGLDGMPAITLPTGEVGDEGLLSPALGAFAGIPGGLPGYINCFDAQDENFLDGIAGAPLDAASINALKDRRVCAVVHDSDISDLGDGYLNAKGSRNGRTAFDVINVVPHPKGGDLLTVLEIQFLDETEVDEACACENLETIDGQPYDCTAPAQ